MKDINFFELIINKIEEQLKLKNITKEQLARMLGKSRSTIFNYFRKPQMIDLETLYNISKILNITPSYFLDDAVKNINIANTGIVNGEVKQIIEHSREVEKENERLKAELEGKNKEIKRLEEQISTLREMIEILKERR